MHEDGENSGHGAPQVVYIQCHGNVDSFSTSPTNVPVAKFRGLPKVWKTRRRFPEDAAMVDFDDKGGGCSGGNEEEERQAAEERESDHPASDGWRGCGREGTQGQRGERISTIVECTTTMN